MDVLRPTATSVVRRARRGRPRGTRTAGQSTRITPGSRVRARSSAPARRRRPVSCASSSWRRSRSGAWPRSCQRPAVRRAFAVGPGPPLARRTADALVVVQREPLDPLEGALDRRSMEPSRSASSDSVASGVSRRASATARTRTGCSREPAVRLERVDRRELAAGGRDRPLEVGRLGVEDAVELAAQRPRDLPRLELEQRRARRRSGAGTSRPSRRSSRSRRRGPGGAATTPAAQLREAAREDRRLLGRDDELEVRPAVARLSEPRARNRPRSQADPAVLGGRRPVERRRRRPDAAGRGRQRAGRPARRPRPAGPRAGRPPARASQTRPSPADSAAGRTPAPGRSAASSARSAVTRSRSERVTVAVAGRAPRRCGRPRAPARRPLSRSKVRRIAAARRAGS